MSALKTCLQNPSPISDDADAALDARAAAKLDTERRERIASCWAASNVPKRHSRPFEPEPESEWAKALARLQARSELGTILFWGNRGSGKTQLACKLIADRCREARDAFYTTAIEIFLELRRYMHEGDEGGVLKRLQKPSLLVIDDVHERGESDWENRMLFHLFDRRYRDMTDTILVTNHQQAEALASLGPSIVDRLRECGGLVPCNWPSFRVRQ